MAHLNYDYIQLRNIQLPLPIRIAPDAWHRHDKAQPAVISVRVSYPTSLVSKSSNADDVNFTLNYGTLYRAIESRLDSRNWEGNGIDVLQGAKIVAGAAQELLAKTLTSLDDGRSFSYQDDEWFVNRRESVSVSVHLPKAILRAAGGLRCKILVQDRGEEDETEVEFKIEGIKCFCIIGVNPHERREKQAVELMLAFRFKQRDVACARFLQSYQELTKQIAEYVDDSTFQTVEALATKAAEIALDRFGLEQVTVNVEKPSAMPFVEFSGIEITRNFDYFRRQYMERFPDQASESA